jgi:hypothetical protein
MVRVFTDGFVPEGGFIYGDIYICNVDNPYPPSENSTESLINKVYFSVKEIIPDISYIKVREHVIKICKDRI